MLFMVEATHRPETCIAARGSAARADADQLAELMDPSFRGQSRVISSWAYPIGHRLWFVVESPDAHSVAELFRAAGVHGWNTIGIHPILDNQEFKRTVLDGITRSAEEAG